MKRLGIAVAVITLALTLSGCERGKSKFEICIEAGGSWEDHAWGDSCWMPGTGQEDNP